jgi:activating signal cointegrator complex subunit 3
MATMNKPTYAAICEHSPTKPALVFVSSRRQTRLTALDLISYCASDDNPKKFLHTSEDEISNIAETLHDKALKNTIVFGVAIHHAGLDNNDRKTVESLYLQGKIQILIATSTLAWGVNLPCHLVVVKGTEYFDGKVGRYVNFEVTDILQMMGRAGRPQFDDTGIACVFVHEPLKNFYRKFLFEPFPVESSLHKQLHEHINAEIVSGVITNLQDCLEYLSWTYYFRRLAMNPSYYQLEDNSPSGITNHLTRLIEKILFDLESKKCIEIKSENDILESTTLGKITSYYYLDYRTTSLFVNGLHSISNATTVMTEKLEQYSRLICDAYEFSEIPVRHNEDVLNVELSQSARWYVDPQTFSEVNTKVFLLLQAHLFNLPLPIMDYINDMKSILEQMPRVLNALIDVAADMGKLVDVHALSKLSQLIYQVDCIYTTCSS